MMKIFKGKFRSETQGACEAVQIQLTGHVITIVNLGGSIYTDYTTRGLEDQIELIPKEQNQASLKEILGGNLKTLNVEITYN